MINMIEKLIEIGPVAVLISIIATASLLNMGKDLILKTLDTFNLKSGRVLKEEAFNNRLDSMDSKICALDQKITDSNSNIHSKQEVYHEQSIKIRGELKDTQNELKANQNELRNQQVDLKNAILELRAMLIDKDIDDMRWELLNFANAVINKRHYNKEQYDHVIDIYDKYERILKENGLENGRVDSSMEFVQNQYQELLKVGFDYNKLDI